jgi:hypothetical protein
MDYTFMTIHELGPDAKILFASDSITDILGYHPSDVQDKSCFEFFHPEEVPFARSIHSRGVLLDKAAVLHYVRIRSRDGDWVSCECCFTVVHDVLVACISIYQGGEKNMKRALEAPQIRRIFSHSPKDPRYHMLQHLSSKFERAPAQREPRAALILNRFTRSLSVMFCTSAIASVLGLPADVVQDKSFYECIRESCLEDAVKCLESAKANDSIAYMRFWSRDPRRPEDVEDESDDETTTDDADQNDSSESVHRAGSHVIKEESDGEGIDDGVGPMHHRESQLSDSDSGGVPLDDEMDLDMDGQSPRVKIEQDADGVGNSASTSTSGSNTQNGVAVSNGSGARRAASSARPGRRQPRYPLPSVELEAVVSCTSDGLVVILRKARPPIPAMQPSAGSVTPQQGVFAAPWGHHPVQAQHPVGAQAQAQPFAGSFAPAMAHASSGSSSGPSMDNLMESIREIAVFAWALVGINGNLASYSRGRPMAGAQPTGGLPIWDPNAGPTSYLGPENQAVDRWSAYENGTLHWPSHGINPVANSRAVRLFEIPGLNGSGSYASNGHPNGYSPFATNVNGNQPRKGMNGHAANGHGSLSHGYNVSKGHGSLNINGQGSHDVNGYNHNGDGQDHYTFGASPWNAHGRHNSASYTNGYGQPATNGNGQHTMPSNGYGQSHVPNGQHNVPSNGHDVNNPPADAAWNFFPGIHQNGTNGGGRSNPDGNQQHRH